MKNMIVIDDFKKLDAEYAVYRLFEVHHLIQMLESKKIPFINPRKWDDPYDSIFLKAEIIKQGRRTKLPQEYYCQCWCRKRLESDAMWRIYSPDKKRVLVKSTPKRLDQYLFNIPDRDIYIGHTKYVTKSQLSENYLKAQIPELIKLRDKDIVKSMLIKYHAYSHENEVRIITKGRPDETSKDIIYLDNPNLDVEFISVIKIDPRADTSWEQYVQKQLSAYGLNHKKVHKSGIYTGKQLKFTIE